jgi:UDP:flavonoid glycosyltransferase YjiC (YdhE family)
MFPCGVYEREFHAETMAKVGAGVVLYERDDFTVQNLRQYSQSILEGNYAANAKRFGDYLRTLGGPDRAVQLLSQIATPSPVVPVGS